MPMVSLSGSSIGGHFYAATTSASGRGVRLAKKWFLVGCLFRFPVRLELQKGWDLNIRKGVKRPPSAVAGYFDQRGSHAQPNFGVSDAFLAYLSPNYYTWRKEIWVCIRECDISNH